MNLLKSLARKILKEEPENDKYHFEKLGNENLAKSRLIKELESDNKRLRIKVEQIRQDNLKLLENRPHFKHHKKKRRAKMNEITIKLPLHKFQTLMHRYVRDSLHDSGTPVLICIHDVKECWAVLDSHTREKIKGEVKFFIEEYHHLHNDERFKASLSAWGELADWINKNRSSTSTTATTAKPIVPVLPVINPKQRKR